MICSTSASGRVHQRALTCYSSLVVGQEQGTTSGLFCVARDLSRKPCGQAQKQEVADLVTWREAVSEQVPEEMTKFDVLVLPSRTVPEWKSSLVMC